MTALSLRVMGQSRSPRRAGLGAYLMGWLVFFDGLASSVLVGKTMRPIADRAGLSREKLAFIVDSTSAPVAGLALLSTWVAYEMSVIRQGLANTGDVALADARASGEKDMRRLDACVGYGCEVLRGCSAYPPDIKGGGEVSTQKSRRGSGSGRS